MTPELRELRHGLRRYLSIKSSYSPQFAPDDRSIAFISDLTGVPQIWTVALEDGAWQQVSPGQERVGFIDYARRSDMIAFGVDCGGNERFQIQVLENRGDSLGEVTDDPETIHQWGGWSPDERSVSFSSNARNKAFFDLYVHSFDSGIQEMVHSQDGNNYASTWTPDGRSILFSHVRSPFNNDLLLLNLSDRSVSGLTPHEGEATYTYPRFDPSGETVYCISSEGREYPALAAINVKDRSLDYVCTEDREMEGLSLSHDGTKAALTVNDEGYSRVMILRLGSGLLESVDTPRSVIGDLVWSNDDTKLAFTLSSSRLNSDVWMYDLNSRSLRRVTRSSTCGLDESSFAEAEPFWFKSFDGLDVPAFLYRPSESGPVPLLVSLHGGPESQFRPGFNSLLQFFVRMGFAVLAPNFRGSTGYGRRFTHLDDVEKRMDTVKDVLAAVHETSKRVDVDQRKIVAWGGSYGGFMVLGCLYSEPDLWCAGVDIVGISNFVTFLKNTGSWRRALRIAEYGDPEKDREFLESISPTNNAHLIKAPLFIIHGSNDPRVPAGEALQIMATMQKLGRESHIMTFDDEGHGLVKLQNRIEAYTNALGFLMHRVTVSGKTPPRVTSPDGPT